MFKSGAVALFAAAVLSPCLAQADTFEQGMNTMWEVLWHQSGTATRLVRWDQDIKVRMFGVNLGAHKQHSMQALRDAAAEAGVKVIDVSDRPDAAQVANVSIEVVPNSSLSENQPCETRLNFKSETTIDSVTMQMRDSDAYRCAYHESMHVMGVRGHPEGSTVLSYFTKHVDSLEPLDKAMLRAWYSPRTKPGMTPFEVLPILADELVGISPDKQLAKLERDQYLQHTVADMQAFADGRGDVPMIVKACGKATPDGIRYGRMEMSYFLGVAYQQGSSVAKDPGAASIWLERAANMGSSSAKTRLLAAGGAQLAGNR
ncbi:hypothetical protein HHL11_20455 [Ramlibacter sp. G-1-2-2]|uniref:Sel1 repeat family protein n=1 Tax=Ramlibacter agri TaxID=2728837 RepID=A0A848H9K1_9BURK|nr:hypothetical protein [Ramlibacter agri]NML46131.1 hypothetical protein [Ramlibacter agri]